MMDIWKLTPIAWAKKARRNIIAMYEKELPKFNTEESRQWLRKRIKDFENMKGIEGVSIMYWVNSVMHALQRGEKVSAKAILEYNKLK